MQVVDAAGRPAARGLRQPLDVRLHAAAWAGALDLAHVRVAVNPALPSWVDLDPGSAPPVTPASGARQATPAGGGSAPRPALGALSHGKATLDPSSMALSAVVPASSSSTAMSFDTDAPVATFGRPDPFETDLSAGALSSGIELDLPAGPGGLTPPLQLAYSSSSVNDQHNAQAAAPWVGSGWNLGLGSVSWAEHNTQSVCLDATCQQNPPPAQWEDSWQLSDPFGTAADLVPPNINVATFNEDSTHPITPSPITWHTAPETRAKVVSIQSPVNAGPCFRVFLASGIMEEFGCTGDSLQWYPGGANGATLYLANWLLDLITDPQGNQVHVTYQRDLATTPGGFTYPRDIVPATVEWDSPGCRDAQTGCTSSWAPLMRVALAASHAVTHVSGASCGPNGSLRCDDPVDLSGRQPAGLPAPLVQSTFVLNDAAVQVRTSGGAGWNTLRDYRFSYSQAGPSQTADPVSGAQESVAGQLLLTRLQEIGADGVAAQPARTFGYQYVPEWYEDSLGAPQPAGNCGPSWNNGQGSHPNPTCLLWSQTFAGTGVYLVSADNGQGLSESFTWALARNNDHGVVSGSAADPMACDNTSVQSTYPCNMPDDESWSRVVLTQRQDSVARVTQAGQGGSQTPTTVTSTWNYSYQVRTPLPAPCGNCVASFYWGNENDFDLLDFYNNRFMGFAQTNVGLNMGLPGGSVEVHKFHTTEGFGLYDPSQVTCNPIDNNHTCIPQRDPWSDLSNAAHGHEYELDRYDSNGSTLPATWWRSWTTATR
ncbi:MAG: hypothetical protein E6J41_32670 [Chloroflexi bacterium]|nr:MAG: hypothetical protein E6J41_32670 [Chloroflexota bacterium]